MSGPGEGAGRPALNMYSPISEIMRREPVAIPLQATVRQALERMERARVGSVVVADPQTGVPLGIFTLQDLVRRVTLPGGDLEQPIACVMTSGLITLGPESSAHQAALEMARHGVRHVVVVDGVGKLAGIVSQNDLFAMQRVGVKEVSGRIQAADDVPGLRRAAQGIRKLTDSLVAQGVSVETLTHFVSTLNDLLTIRTIELTADEFDLPPIPMCWIALGSEGRLEQTFSTDQDNGIVFDADEADVPLVRTALLPFARAVNQKLDACGFPLCAGNIMAGNPEWCLTLAGWKRTFSRWIQEPQPQALRNATIFFDFRPIYGNASLAERLREWLISAVAGRPLFLRQMAENAIEVRPPLGTLRDFAYDGSREYPHTLDLKMNGSLLFADAARILGLARGVPYTSTAQRLRSVAERGLFSPESLAALLDGFHFIHLLRLRSQGRPARGRGGQNRVDPRELNELERHVLREAFRQARKLQDCLVMEYRLRS
jgi:CBS domain-containing protein